LKSVDLAEHRGVGLSVTKTNTVKQEIADKAKQPPLSNRITEALKQERRFQKMFKKRTPSPSMHGRTSFSSVLRKTPAYAKIKTLKQAHIMYSISETYI